MKQARLRGCDLPNYQLAARTEAGARWLDAVGSRKLVLVPSGATTQRRLGVESTAAYVEAAALNQLGSGLDDGSATTVATTRTEKSRMS